MVWDLDGTLGPQPGWNGPPVPLSAYIGAPEVLKATLATLASWDIRHILSSRNAMVCGPDLGPTAAEFAQYGFHAVADCPRAYMDRSKVLDIHEEERIHTLLIDDRHSECKRAVADGAHALYLKDPDNSSAPALNAVGVLGAWELMSPDTTPRGRG
jgi:hypothetical protein